VVAVYYLIAKFGQFADPFSVVRHVDPGHKNPPLVGLESTLDSVVMPLDRTGAVLDQLQHDG
jgi:hypothetical protein